MADQDNEMGDTWILFRPLKHDVPSAVRLRALLKAALRAWKLKAVRVNVVGPAADGGNGNPVSSPPPASPRPAGPAAAASPGPAARPA